MNNLTMNDRTRVYNTMCLVVEVPAYVTNKRWCVFQYNQTSHKQLAFGG